MTAQTVVLPEGVQHGTPEGNLAGCKDGLTLCPAAAEHGMSCTSAMVQSQTRPAKYAAAKRRDARPAAIARMLGYVPRRPRPAATEDQPARPVAPPPAPARPAKALTRTQQIRAWAREHGLHAPQGGPMSKALQAAFDANDPDLARRPPEPQKRRAKTPAQAPPAAPAEFAEALDQVRARIDMPTPDERTDTMPEPHDPTPVVPEDRDDTASEANIKPRPEWATVVLTNEREHARATAARLWDELERAEERAAQAEARATLMESALVTVIRLIDLVHGTDQ